MPGYQLKTESLAVGGAPTLARSLLDRQRFADPLGAALALGISSASWPLFGLVWPSALVLAAHMVSIPFGARHVLEVGCGLALASPVVHRRSGFIAASDHQPLAEALLRENLRLNAGAADRGNRGLRPRHARAGLCAYAAARAHPAGRQPAVPGLLLSYPRVAPA